jgi:hypothetical protein
MSESVKDVKEFLSKFPDDFRVDVDWDKDDCGDIVKRSIIIYDLKFNEMDYFITYLE